MSRSRDPEQAHPRPPCSPEPPSPKPQAASRQAAKPPSASAERQAPSAQPPPRPGFLKGGAHRGRHRPVEPVVDHHVVRAGTANDPDA